MLSFLRRSGPDVIGSLSGSDRLRWRGPKRLPDTAGGMPEFPWHERALPGHFEGHAREVTPCLRRRVEPADADRPLTFLDHGGRKEDLARRTATC